MIVFLNFAPIDFMGGAEKWMLSISELVNKKEPTILIDVSSNISNIYGGIVLGRSFTRERVNTNVKRITLSYRSFLPWTKSYKEVTKVFKECRLIYFRYELQEALILLFFGRIISFKKSVAGFHSPFMYNDPISVLDHIHNIVYTSFLSRKVLKTLKKIHVLNISDKNTLKNKYHLNNVLFIPNGIIIDPARVLKKPNADKLHVLFMGELSTRKGIDKVQEIIRRVGESIQFHIAGDGPKENEIKRLANEVRNLNYYGRLDRKGIRKVLARCDLLLFPSRAESMSLTVLECMSYGLYILDSTFTSLNLPNYIEKSILKNNVEEYIKQLNEFSSQKKVIDRKRIANYCQRTFPQNKINNILEKKLFN